MTADLSKRHVRSSGIVDPDLIRARRPLVVGVGAVGALVARQLAHLGSPATLVDHDTVDDVNLGCQGFNEADLGRPKVDAVRDAMLAIDPSLAVETSEQRYARRHLRGHDVVFSCVDSITVRQTIFENACPAGVAWLGDSRIAGGSAVRVVQCRPVDPDTRGPYRDSLFAEDEAVQGSCTTKTTIYGAFVTAGLLLHEYARFLRGFEGEQDVSYNLLANEMTIHGAAEPVMPGWG